MKHLFNAILPVFLLIMLTACGSDNEKTSGNEVSSGHKGHMMPPADGNYCDSINAGLIRPDTMKGSPVRTAMATINGTHIHIEYGSPGVKDRIIWGGLVAYDKVWATGAHNATTVQFSAPVIIGGKEIPKGTYGLFTIPGRSGWQVILNTRFEQHLADDYSVDEDIVRIAVQPKQNSMTQRLTYYVTPAANDGGEISMRWEKVEIIIPFKTNVV
ncbi:DUF2911 domain-containing protein [Terrimonas sp. NA20]|uniref:DUF2911 domain-containing protein n=1 Tax=Terrimonas ginsenosidimutans TaxID=2908004 RepID=A0ABS9KXA7_9BACT|nr:DUF2911 domain-containing protein [Terrimonas ginsenosidimutans]MCG2617009.1 DUF2911 domain-containing protein [Terrimonas ginsenosidimutans]